MKNSRPPLLPAAVEPGGVVDEVALEAENAALEQSQQCIHGLLPAMKTCWWPVTRLDPDFR